MDMEAEFSKKVATYFRTLIRKSEFVDTVKVQERIKILKDLTIGKDRDGDWRLIAGLQQQDLVFFAPHASIPMSDFRSKCVRIDKYDRTGEKPIIIPLVVCELKIGSLVNTHALITYASISNQLKSIFPHCAYYFIMDSNQECGMKPETVLRHSKGFDRVFLSWYFQKEKSWSAIHAHLRYLKEQGII